MEHGDTGSCTLCDSSFEFYNQTSTTHKENIGQVQCFPHKTECEPGYGFTIGSSHT